jgi:hypothetical protein
MRMSGEIIPMTPVAVACPAVLSRLPNRFFHPLVVGLRLRNHRNQRAVADGNKKNISFGGLCRTNQ